MTLISLYLVMLEATMTTFSGGSSIAVAHNGLVVRHKMLTDRQFSAAVAMGRLSPGPNAVYLVCAGYLAAGTAGAAVGAAAMITPAFVIIPVLRRLGRRAEHESVKRCIRAVVLAAAGLILASSIPLARDAIVDWRTAGIAAGSLALLVFTRVETVWVILGSALAGFLAL